MSNEYTVRVNFLGIVAFVPNVPLNFIQPSTISKVDVYFPDVREAYDSGKDIKDGVLRSPHFLWIEIGKEHLASTSTRKVTTLYRPSGGGPERAIFLVEKEERFFLNSTTNSRGLVLNQTLPSNHALPMPTPDRLGPLERKSLWWIPRPYELGTSTHGEFDVTKPTLGSLTVENGEMFTGGFSREEKAWSFFEALKAGVPESPPVNPKFTRAIGNRVVLELSASQFSVSSTSGTIVLEAGADRVIDLWFRNVEPELLLEAEVPPTGPDPDFAEFYRRSKGHDVFPWVLPFGDGSGGSVLKPCAPAFFSS